MQLGSGRKKSKQKPEGDEAAVGSGGSGAEEDPVLALSKLLDAEYNAGPWPAVQLQKGDDGYKFGTRFKQQRYKVTIVPWQSPVFMLAFGVLVGAIFISFGGVTLEAAEGLRVVRKVYDCNFPGSKEKCACDGMASCTTPLEVPLGMDGDLVLFYELGGFKQNHRRYKPSFALPQLRYGNPGVAKPDEDDLEDCEPRTQQHRNVSDGFTPLVDYGYIVRSGLVDMPCGLHTGWVYDDDVRVLNASGGAVGTRWEYGDWDTTPPKLLNSTDQRFTTWMRTSPFVVRKPLLLIKGGLRAGTYDLAIENRYDPAIFRGRKTLVLAEFSASGGGRSSKMVLGVISIVVGVLALSAAALVLGLSVWKGSPLRKRRKLLEEMLLLAEQGERNSSLQYSDMGGDMGPGADGADEAIRRGIDLIEKYSVAPTVEALEKAMASRSISAVPSSLFDAARLLGRTSSVQVEASTSNAPTSEVGEVRETGGD